MNGLSALAKIDLKYIQAVRAKGRVYHYFRRDGMPRERLTGEPESAEFIARYAELVRQSEDLPTRPDLDTLAETIVAYKSSPDFIQLKPKTRKDYTRYLDLLSREYGDLNITTMPRAFIFGLRDEYGETPRTANYLVQVLRIVLGYAVDRGVMATNPAARPKMLRTGDGHEPWEEAEIEAYRAHWLLGSLERTAFEILLNTGQRGGDTIAMTRQDYRNGWVKVCQEKTKAKVEIPASDALQSALTPWLDGHKHLVILVSGKGRPFKTDWFRHVMAAAYEAAGLGHRTTHGLRYTAAIRLREVGCDWETIGAILGHKTAEMARKYSAKKRLAQIGIAKIQEAERTKGD